MNQNDLPAHQTLLTNLKLNIADINEFIVPKILDAMRQYAEQERAKAFREGYRMAVIPNKQHLISLDYPEFQKINELK